MAATATGGSSRPTRPPARENPLVDTTRLQVSSGLPPGLLDWNHTAAKGSCVDPDIVVITFGGNDAQGLLDSSGGVVAFQPVPDSDNAEWRAEYGKRVGEVMDFLAEDGRSVIWVGIPNDDSPDVTFRMQVQDETAKAEAAKRPGVVFIDTWKRFSGRTGGWAEYVIDPRDGAGKDVRADDGFHLNETGAEILALDIAEAIKPTSSTRRVFGLSGSRHVGAVHVWSPALWIERPCGVEPLNQRGGFTLSPARAHRCRGVAPWSQIATGRGHR